MKSSTHYSSKMWVASAVFLFCALALVLRIYVRYGSPNYLFYGTSATGLPESDAITWYLHALNVFEGRGFGENIRQFATRNFVPPGHPLLLTILMRVTGPDPVRMGWVIAFLSSLLPLTTYLWVREMWGPRVGLWASFLAAIHAPFMHIAFSLMSEPMSVLATSLAFLFGARAIRRQGVGDVALAGLVFGLAALVRPVALAFLWGAAGALLLLRHLSWSRRFLLLAVWLAMTALPQAGWQYRNYRVHGVWATIYSSISARHVWTAANPVYRPYFYSRQAWHETMWAHPHESEIESIRRMQAEARAWIREDRLKFAMGCIWRMSHLFPELRRREIRIPYSQGGWGRFHFASILVLAPLGLLIALRSRTRRNHHGDAQEEISGALWGGILGVGTAIALIGAGMYGAAPRYRWPLEYAWIPFVALFLERLTQGTRIPLFGSALYEWPDWPSSRIGHRAKRIVVGVMIAFLLFHATDLIRRNTDPLHTEKMAAKVSQPLIEDRLQALGLSEEWSAQSPQRISYAEVFEEQKDNFGAVVTFGDKLVVWWGVLRLPIFDGQGLRSGYIIIETYPERQGLARLDLIRHADVEVLDGAWEDGDVITVIGRLEFRKRPIGRPNLMAYEVLPGRLYWEE